jgi:O-antigen/teichoic acid export membrane protein
MAMMSGLESSVLRLTATNAVLTVVLLFALAPTLGLLGVAIAWTVTVIVINIAVMLLLRQRLSFRWWNPRFLGWLAPSAASGAVGLAVLYSGYAQGIVVLAATLTGMYLVFAAVLFVRGFNEDERDLLRHLRGRLLGGASAE